MLRFNMMLEEAGLPPKSVRLLRHNPILPNRMKLIDQWHKCPADVVAWQSIQDRERRAHLGAPFWAAFIGTPDGRTVLDGVYAVGAPKPIEEDVIRPLSGELLSAGTVDQYALNCLPMFAQYAGRLTVEWGGGASGKRAWVQRADLQDKQITALLERPFELAFPGYMQFEERMSALGDVSPTWASHLMRARGVYLLTCPETGKHYTGSANGSDGFWGRWCNYRATGDGGNVGLKGLETGGFLVSILQVAGSSDTGDDILAFETAWKRKLGSREFGLNFN